MIRFTNMLRSIQLFPVFTVLFYLSVTVCAKPGDTFMIDGSIVNIRGGPGTDYPVVLKFRRGLEVIETSRVNDWVEVNTNRSDVEVGWVHDSLLVLVKTEPETEMEPEPEPVDETSPAFATFMKKFNHYLELRREETGFVPFTKVMNMGSKVIRVTASEEWLQKSLPYRETELTTIFRMWDKNEGSGDSLSVEVIDTNGDKVMHMHR